MSTVAPHDGEALTLSVLLDHVAHVTVLDARFDALYRFFQTFPSVVDQFARLFAGSAHEEGFVQVAMVVSMIDSDIDVDDVTVLQGSEVGNSVAYHLIYAGATAFWELRSKHRTAG